MYYCIIFKIVYKTFHFRSIFYCLFRGPFIKSHSKKVTQKVGREGESNKRINRLRTFLDVSTKFEKTNNSVYSVLLLPIYSESLSNREEHRSFCELS